MHQRILIRRHYDILGLLGYWCHCIPCIFLELWAGFSLAACLILAIKADIFVPLLGLQEAPKLALVIFSGTVLKVFCFGFPKEAGLEGFHI